jgi:hypothetical protein
MQNLARNQNFQTVLQSPSCSQSPAIKSYLTVIYDSPRLKADAYFMFQNDHLIVNTSSSQMTTINIYP